jgi:hypothetical protein
LQKFEGQAVQSTGHTQQITHPNHGPFESFDAAQLDLAVLFTKLPGVGGVDAEFAAFPYDLPARVAFDDFRLDLQGKCQRANDKLKASID